MTRFAERFWAYVAKADRDGCWLWIGNVSRCGYGRIHVSGRNLRRSPLWSGGADKTRCVNGHEFDETNTYWRKGHQGQRACRLCNRDKNRRYRARRALRVVLAAAGTPALVAAVLTVGLLTDDQPRTVVLCRPGDPCPSLLEEVGP